MSIADGCASASCMCGDVAVARQLLCQDHILAPNLKRTRRPFVLWVDRGLDQRTGVIPREPPSAVEEFSTKKLGGSFILPSAASVVDNVLPWIFTGIGYPAQVAWGGAMHCPHLR